MDSDEFPADNYDRVVAFPVYLLRDETGTSFATHTIADGSMVIVLLTDGDALNRYRTDMEVPERGAVKFTTPHQLLAVLYGLPPIVKAVCFDMLRRSMAQKAQVVHVTKFDHFRTQLALSIGPPR